MSEESLPSSEYALLELLDLLESVIEEMDEVGVRTRDEAEALIATVHEHLDALERAGT